MFSRLKFPSILILAVWIILWGLSYVLAGLTIENKVLLSLITACAILVPSFSNFESKTATCVMACLCLMLGFGVILNTYCFTTYSGGTPTEPVLRNIDFGRWWNDALYHLGDKTATQANVSHGYYGYVLAGALAIFGKTVGAALLWSMTTTLTSVIVVGFLTYKLTSEKRIAALGMICFASVCYLLCMGTVILKDSFFILAIALAGYGFTCRGWKYTLIMLLVILMVFAARRNYLFMLIIGMFVVSFRPGNFIPPIICTLIALALWYIPELCGFNSGITYIVSADERTQIHYNHDQQLALYNIIGDYSHLSLLNKILILPLSAVVQYFVPFPWNFFRDFDGGFTMFYAHISFMWYIFGFCAMYFFVSQWCKFFTPLYCTALFGLMCWFLPCYLFGGTISRYALCSVALMAPAVAVTVYKNYKSKKFYIWFAAYAVVVCVVLLVAHHLQTSAMR